MAGERRRPTRRDYALFPEGYRASPRREAAAVMGDRRNEKIYLTVGYALSEWERFEQSLVVLYQVFLGTWHYTFELQKRVARSYGAIESSTARLQAMGAAAEKSGASMVSSLN